MLAARPEHNGKRRRGQKDEKKERKEDVEGREGAGWREKEERCRDLANRVPHCCSRQIFTEPPDVSKINNKMRF